MGKGGSAEVQEKEDRKIAVDTRLKDQRGELAKFRESVKAEETKASEALKRIRGNPDLDREERLDAYGRLLKAYAATRKVHEIAGEYDKLRGQVEHATSDELDEKFNKAKLLLSEGKP
jgi:hypothetical protein